MDPSKQTQETTVPPQRDQEDGKKEPAAAPKKAAGHDEVVKEARQSGQDDFIAMQDQEGYASPMRPAAHYGQPEEQDQLTQDDLTVRRAGVTNQTSEAPAMRADTLMRRGEGQDSASVLEHSAKRHQEPAVRESQKQ